MSNLKESGSEFSKNFVSPSLEKRLSVEVKQELASELKSNPEYFQTLEKDEDFQMFIRTHFKRKEVSPALVNSIRAKMGI